MRIWKKIPEQIRHLLVPCAIILGGFLVARAVLIPPDFGLVGHYRASSVIQNADKPIMYAGAAACAECHETEVATKQAGFHRGVSCEACHGPTAAHATAPETTKPFVPKGRSYCLLCHEYQPSRPTGFPQIVADSHNPVKACVSCHQPHDPKPPETPKGCEACHAKIQRTIALSRHSTVACTVCHETPAKHKMLPREFIPKKPQTREFCGKCHGKGGGGDNEIPKVDMNTHGERHLCWECHYPHMPEAQ